MNLKTLTIFSILTLGMAFQASAQVNFKYQDQSISLEKAPKTLAVYEISALDTLNALGLDVQLVPKASFSGSLSHYEQDQYIKAGTLFEPDLAVLKKAQPDLIIIGGRSASKANSLNSIAPTLNLSPNTSNYMVDLKERSLTLAQAFGKQKIAQEKLEHIAHLQAELKTKTQGKSAMMLFAVGENFMPHAENDRFGFVYDFAGFKSVLGLSEKSDAPRAEAGSPEALKAEMANIQRIEAAVTKNPDYIIVLDRGAVNTQKYTAQHNIVKHPSLKNAQAVKDNKVIYVNADAWYITGAGLNNTIFMLEELNKAL